MRMNAWTRIHPVAATALHGARFSLILIAGLSASHAAEPPRVSTAPPATLVSNKPECTCRAGGQSYGIGTEICIGNRMMRCAMAINVTSWEQTERACPQS